MIKAVTFDFWNTLYTDSNFDERLKVRVAFVKERLKALGFDRSDVQIQNSFEVAGKKWLEMWREQHRSFSPHDIVKAVLYGLEAELDENTARTITRQLSEITLKVRPALIRGAADMLKQISGSYRVGLISDTAATPGSVLRRIMAQDRLEKHFSVFVFSDEVGFTKPARLNFQKALSALHSEPEDSAHVGDMERTDIEGAKSAGMKAVLFAGVNGSDVGSTKADLVIKSYEELAEKLKGL